MIDIELIFVIGTGVVNAIAALVYIGDKLNKRDIRFRYTESRAIGSQLRNVVLKVLRSRVVQTVMQWTLGAFNYLLTALVTAVVFFLVARFGDNIIAAVAPPTPTPQVGISSPTPRISPTPIATPTVTPSSPTPIPTPIRYAVQVGDTYGSIAGRFDVLPEALMDFNDVFDPDDIFPGRVLRIPSHIAHITERRKVLDNTIVAVVNAESGLHVRDSPNIYGRSQRVALEGSRLTLTGVSKPDNGNEWFELTSGEWVQGQYLLFFSRIIVAEPDGLLVFERPDVWARTIRHLPFEEEVHLTGRFRGPDTAWAELRGGGWASTQSLRIELTTKPPS